MTSEKPALYGMRAQILRSSHNLRPNPNNMISGDLNVQVVYVVGDGVPGLHPVLSDAPLVAVREIAGRFTVAYPADKCPPDRYGFMASGAYIVHRGSFDEWLSYFGHELPIPLHDKTERRQQPR
ncbi:hypothetical protein [Amycolatopsis vastitatis]|uniref:Uncharacterized protein n=1 Tax=Amycolatopsis vastitatis TaxID=1905142 RepID=A0A229TEV5_9PSEU|nr:hypothetical protein [Amycolatopsis vastitatis]OXM69673.1 hypothetical protein CF165_09190 [Amycolatopsis vastitatis]